MTIRSRSLLLLVIALLAAALAGCGRERPSDTPAQGDTGTGGETAAFEEQLSGRIRADGSSTVAPFTTLAAERFRNENPDVRISVGVSGTGGGFERFCRGETDLSNASRPIKDEEKAACRRNGVEYLELHVANDALSVVVNRENDWADCLSVAQLRTIWRPGSRVDNWNEVDGDFPDEELRLFGPGTDSGTFDYFTDEINGEEGASRTDYSATEDDNVVVRGVTGEQGGLGYFGFSYYEQNRERLKALEIDGGDGCVAPSVETVQNGSYKPLSRPLFIYVKQKSFDRFEVEAFVDFLLTNQAQIARGALFVPLTGAQLQKARDDLEAAVSGLG
jgi:phosphate transport system substrate-binding protein